MAFSKPKYSPYLGTQAFLFYDTTTNNKSAVKSTDSISAVRPKVPSTKIIYTRAQLVPSASSRIVTEETSYSTRVNSHEIALRTFNRQTVSILQAKFNKQQETTPKQNYKIRLKSESVATEPPQINIRLSTSSERKPNRVFRIRGSTLGNPAYPSLFENLKIDLTQKSQVIKTASLPSIDIEPTFSATKILGLERMCFNAPAQGRMELPLLIVHFEGIIGSCLVANRKVKENSEKDKDSGNSVKEYFFVKKDTKEELKRLSKNFLIAVVFPSANNRYKPMIEHFMNKKLLVDGIYYKPDISATPDANRIANFILDYGVITSDFKARKTHKKVVVLLSLNLHRSIIKEQLLSQGKNEGNVKPALYEKTCFVHFFPKINIDSNNLKIVCLPNFLLEDKNEKFANLSKTRLSHASKIFMQVLKSLGIEPKDPEQTLRKTQEIVSTSSSATTPSNKENEVTEGDRQQTQQLTHKVLNNSKGLNNKVKQEALKALNLNELILELEKTKQRNSKFRHFEAIKESNNVIRGQSTHSFDVGMIRQKMIEELVDIQRAKKSANKSANNGNSKVSIVSVVGSLFNNNSQLFKAYEKADFYSSRKGMSIIADITKCMEKSKESATYRDKEGEMWNGSMSEFKDSVDKGENELERRSSMPNFLTKEKSMKIKKRIVKTGDKQGFFSQSMRAKMVEKEEEVLALQLIKRLATDVGIYLGD